MINCVSAIDCQQMPRSTGYVHSLGGRAKELVLQGVVWALIQVHMVVVMGIEQEAEWECTLLERSDYEVWL